MSELKKDTMLSIKKDLENSITEVLKTLVVTQTTFSVVLDMDHAMGSVHSLTSIQTFNIQEWSLETSLVDDEYFEFMYADNNNTEYRMVYPLSKIMMVAMNGQPMIINQFYKVEEELIISSEWKNLPDGYMRSLEMFKSNPANAKLFNGKIIDINSEVVEEPELDPII